eukprot:scaffold13974_cov36-Cyclotella_meneghiniana.AAC.5
MELLFSSTPNKLKKVKTLYPLSAALAGLLSYCFIIKSLMSIIIIPSSGLHIEICSGFYDPRRYTARTGSSRRGCKFQLRSAHIMNYPMDQLCNSHHHHENSLNQDMRTAVCLLSTSKHPKRS